MTLSRAELRQFRNSRGGGANWHRADVSPEQTWLFPFYDALVVFGVLLIIPIGGADMPTVIALLNSYAGLSASAMGFVLDNKLLIVAGALDGSSGFILSIIMCRAMNRSFTNVLFGAFGQFRQRGRRRRGRSPSVRQLRRKRLQILDAARSVIIIPGYGMAVAQAQHKLREMFDVLTNRGVNVRSRFIPSRVECLAHIDQVSARGGGRSP